MRITSKRQFYELYRAGTLGNTVRQWQGPVAALQAEDSGVPFVGFREIGRAGGGKFEIVSRKHIAETAYFWRVAGREFNISEAAPDHLKTISGEICRTTGGLQGYFNFTPGLRMRDAMLQAEQFSGLRVKLTLDHYMDGSSRDCVDDLLDLFPDAVIEFACYTVNVGVVPNRNTIIWEVRNY